MSLISDFIYFRKMGKLMKEFKKTGLVGIGWLPWPSHSIVQADGLIELFDLHITRRGLILKWGRDEEWTVWPPGSYKKPHHYGAAFNGQGNTLCEATLKCLIQMHKRGLIRGGLYSRYYYGRDGEFRKQFNEPSN